MSSSSNPDQRIPLSNSTNSLVPSRSPSPQDASIKPTAPQVIHRKASFRRLNPRADSSEDAPSLHSSIFDAPYCSSSEGGDSGERYDAKVSQIRRAVDIGYGGEAGLRVGEVSAVNTGSFGPGSRDRWTRSGGTPLETIIERKSATTIRSSASLPRTHSLDGAMPSGPLSPAPRGVSPATQTRRKRSFSFDDIIHLDCGKRRSNSNATDGPLPPPKAYFDYASPNMPTHNRPERIPTPPGLPSWSPSAQPVGPDTTATVSPPRGRGFLFRSSSPRAPPPPSVRVSESPVDIQNPNQRHSATTPGGSSRFRPPPSGHRSYGSLDMHPFHRAPLAKSWDSTGRPITRRRIPSRPQSVMGGNAMRMQYMRPVRDSTDGATGATTPVPARTTNPPTLCPHAKRNQQSSTDQSTNRGSEHYPAPTSGDLGAGRCWRCHLSHWTEQFPMFCCGDVGDRPEGAGSRNFSVPPPPLPAYPRFNDAGI
ncbi:MAG: hypothetical protein M1813_007831 [Trichoglossum hirsutum]|nr:MAG: hypothetical protein M1813_007831 [Trichoglossum hirsutum]